MQFYFKNGEYSNSNSWQLTEDHKWISNPLPELDTIHKVEMLIYCIDSRLSSLRMYNKNGLVIFTTGGWIEHTFYRKDPNRELVSFVLSEGERIIQIRSHDFGSGKS